MRVFKRIVVAHQQIGRHKSTQGVSPQAYCISLVKKHDFENYLCTLFLRRKEQACAFAIRAFNIEVANIEGQVSQLTIGQMRLKFWEESINKIFNDNPPQHPVAQEVHRVLDKSTLNKKNLQQLVSARADKLSMSSFQSIEQMEKYSERTCSPIFYLLLASCGVENVQADHAFSHIGKAQGLTNLIRSVPYYAQRRMVILPQDILAKHKVSHESIIRGECDKPNRDAIFDVACQAKTHLDKALSLVGKVPNSVFRQFLPVVPVQGYLERLRKVDFDVFHPTLQRRDTNLALKLLWRTIRRKL